MPSQVFNQAAFRAKSPRELTDAVADFMDCSVVIPPTEIRDEAALGSIISFQKKLLQDRVQSSDPSVRQDSKPRKVSFSSSPPPEDPLSRTGRPFGGMMRDIKRRYRYYKSDITDALNAQVIAAVIFIYFAALSPAVTFGGLLDSYVLGVNPLRLNRGRFVASTLHELQHPPINRKKKK
ncbi:Band 3 anion exchange protein [Liparis tanakae]|uniref:Band 3 anion exchange protein n=1 Tax=Liparis tanakae TaxID=230148 RepID=A0A4Z2HK53_9TELE|nr:Band 3 anion exchange protein [Liparis tanakae]